MSQRKFIKHTFLTLCYSIFVCALTSCSIDANSSNDNFSIEGSNVYQSTYNVSGDTSFSSMSSIDKVDEKYIVGKRIFDPDYNNYPNPKSTIKIDEFPGLEFSYNTLNSSYSIESLGVTFNYCYSFYIADINQDGYFELCYSFVKGSGIVNYGISIFDVHNKVTLFENEERGKLDYLFDLDDKGYLIIEELKFNDHKPHLLNKALHFVKNLNKNLLFEEFTFDSKLKGFLCGDGSGNKDQYRLNILLIHVGTKDRHYLNINEITVEGIVDFTYKVENYPELVEGSPDLILSLSFKDKTTTNITIKIQDIKQIVRISAL